MRRFTWIVLISMAMMLAACGGNTAAPGASGPGEVDPESVVRWPRDPQHVLFRAEIVGADATGEGAIYQLNDIPICTIYGDGRIVWTVSNAAGMEDVRFDLLNDETIMDFVNFLVVTNRVYTYEAGYDTRVPTTVQPVYEKLALNVNDVEHVTDAFAEWPAEYFEDIVERCKTIAPTPRVFEPEGAWLTTTTVDYNTSIPSLYWDAEAAGLSLLETANTGERRWIEGQNVAILWNVLRDNPPDIQFNEGQTYLNIALQIPGVTINAPLAPAQ